MTMFKKLDMDTLCRELSQKRKTLIVYHVRSDADAVGSAFALRELMRMMGVPAICVCAEEVPDRLKFLSEDLQGTVVVEEGAPLGHEFAISVDSASPSQLGSMFERLRKDVDIMIDHHAVGSVYADSYIDASAAATGEIIYAIAKRLVELEMIPAIPPKVLECIYAAVSSDTGCFKFANVTPATHRIAAELVEAGVDTADINHRLFDCKSQKQMAAEAEAVRRMRVFAGGRVASVSIPYITKYAMGLDDGDLETVIDIPRSLEGVEVAFVVKQLEDKPYFRISMRSAVDFDVSAVCRKFGGGGHARAAGCSLEAADADEAENIIAAEIIKAMK